MVKINFILFLNVAVFLYHLANSLKPTPQGLYPAAFTPFDENGKLNIRILPEFAAHLRNSSIDGVLVAGTNGESGVLSIHEKMELLTAWINIGKPIGLNVIMHVGGMPLPSVLKMASYAESVGADAILTLPEIYYKPKSVEEAVAYLKLVAEAAPSLPIFYYHHPPYSGVNLNVAKLFSLATETIPNFKGVKCSFAAALEIIASNNLRDDQTLFPIGPAIIASNSLMGFNSSPAASCSIFPELFVQIQQAVRNGNVERAKDLQMILIKRMGAIYSVGDTIPSQKAAMEIVTGIKLGNTRVPVSHLTAEQRSNLRNKLLQLDVLCVSV